MKRREIRAGIDLGVSEVRLFTEEGILFEEPCILALDQKDQVLASGNQAAALEDLQDSEIRVFRPLKKGAADMEILLLFLEQLCTDCGLFRFLRKTVLVLSCPDWFSVSEMQTIQDHLLAAGAEQVFVDRQIMFSALGARINIYSPVPVSLLNISGGCCDIAVFERGEIKASSSSPFTGQTVREQVTGWLRMEKQLIVTEETADRLIRLLGGFQSRLNPLAVEIRGLNPATLTMETAVVDENQMVKVLAPILREWAAWLTGFLLSLPPRDLEDIRSRGIIACGGILSLKKLSASLQLLCGIPVFHTDHPGYTCCQGISFFLQKISSSGKEESGNVFSELWNAG